ncbi:hypothetical protein JOD45_002578 [Scopulibacillus daqui]|uniref:Competence protein ComGG n=1 Tax=Scopulibacillus daqui TaxID=1469162 RepID=A0ABS2Q3G0_9BACL|nr:competence type IV pilus minor pilin ComGG [Scopulibacillus daqui]MBM7646350.1 hypothetical protein [Scopulibacillus daqui]
MKQQGFILPLAVIVVSIFTFFLLHVILISEIDRDFLRERISLFEFGELGQLARTDITAKITEKNVPKKGSMHYAAGDVKYRTRKINDDVVEVAMTLEKRAIKKKQTFHFDIKQGHIVKWEEGQ